MSVHLYTRSSFTLLESTLKIQDYVSFAKQEGYEYVALTDHNVLHGVPSFLRACNQEGMKPIFGMECDVLFHNEVIPFLLLAKNNAGYQNLIQASSVLNQNDRPLTLDEFNQYAMHCFVIAYGEGGYLESALIRDDRELLRNQLQEMIQELPSFDIALSYQDSSLWRMKNQMLKGICRSLKISTCALNKIYYLKQEDANALRILNGIKTGKVISDQSLPLIKGRHYLTKQEMQSLYEQDDLQRTDQIAKECVCNLSIPKTDLPLFPVPDGITQAQYLTQLCLRGLEKRFQNKPKVEYYERLKKELDVIISMHFENYFLIVYDYIRFARSQNILVGPGRGSAAGSLVAYCLGITQVDPIVHHLLFERFLNPERISMPDIDTDFPDVDRNRVIQYVQEKYGRDHVANIVTFGTLGARQVIRDVGRVLEINSRELDTLIKMLPNDPKVTIRSQMNQDLHFQKYVNGNHKFQNLISLSIAIEGLPRHKSTHAAGIVMSRLPLSNIIPTVNLEDTILTTQYTAEYLEQFGLIKMDFLSLRNLTIMQLILDKIHIHHPSFQLKDISYSDAKTYRVFAKGDTLGIFQFESNGMKRLLTQMKPDQFGDIVASLALYRPGPVDNIPTYLAGKKDPSSVKYPIANLESILKETYGVMIYQEQIMLIAREIAGFTLGKADILRKAISKKNIQELEKIKDDFIRGAIQNGHELNEVETIYSLIEKFAGYGFNKSHAVAYGMISYQLAWLKANAPIAFYCCMLDSFHSDVSKTYELIQECRQRGIQVLPPDINQSDLTYQYKDRSILLPFTAIKGFSVKMAEDLIQERNKRHFDDFFDVIARCQLLKFKKDTIESLIHSGCLDGIGHNRTTMVTALDDALSYGDLVRIEKNGQTMINLDLVSKPVVVLQKEDLQVVAEKEREALGYCLKKHPILPAREFYQITLPSLLSYYDVRNTNVECFAQIDHIRPYKTKKGSQMGYISVSDETASVDLVVFPKVWKEIAANIVKGNFIVFQARIDEQGQYLVDRIQVMENGEKKWRKY